jgi:pimeloyl-ACP methyl ester carboxylesterase
VEWGGSGDVLLFLTPLGASAHEFDDFAPEFTDHFRVLGVTRRGQSPSERPPSGYDTATLAEGRVLQGTT